MFLMPRVEGYKVLGLYSYGVCFSDLLPVRNLGLRKEAGASGRTLIRRNRHEPLHFPDIYNRILLSSMAMPMRDSAFGVSENIAP